MKKTLALILGVLMIVACLAGCSSSSQGSVQMEVSVVPSEEASASESASESSSAEATESASAEPSGNASAATEQGEVLKRIVEAGKIVMLTNAEFPPYEYVSETDIAGIDVDICQAIADEIGVDLEVVNMDFDGLVPALLSGKGDIIAAGMTVDPERAESVDFSDPYADATQSIIVPKEGATVASEDDLTGKTIGVQLGTTGDLLASDIEGATVQQYKSGIEASLDLKNGRLDAVVLDQLPAESIVANNDDLTIVEMESTNEQYAIAVDKGNEDLVQIINGVIAQLLSDGTMEEIVSKHVEAVRN